MLKTMEVRDTGSTASMKKLNRCRSFHFRYLELCRSKNLTPLSEIRTKNNNATSILDFFGDKLGVGDWLLVIESLYYDQVLQTVCIRQRKNIGSVLDHMDTEKKARLFRQKPVIYTKFIFSGVVEAVSNCIAYNKNLKVLCLEGLPLSDKYVESIAKALSSNESIQEISFQRSGIQDKGCEAICNTMKYLENVVKLNLSECDLTSKGAEHVAEMMKIQKITRYTEGWQKSLRYRDVDPDSMPGLRMISLSRNPQIGDDGLKPIVEILKEDVWVKVIDMENCGLTDRAANMILDCLELNNYIIEFNVRANPGISKFLMRSIRDQLGKDTDDDQKSGDGQLMHAGTANMVHNRKPTLSQLKEHIKTLEEQLDFERLLRKKAEQLNEKLNQQILAYENQLEEQANANVPEGFVVVKNESLQSIINERNNFEKIAIAAKKAALSQVPQGNVINRFKQQNNLMPSQKQQYQKRQQEPQMADSKVHAQMKMYEHSKMGDDLEDYTESEEMTPCHTPMPSARANVHKVRKVKSEVKYVEPSSKGSAKNESKSDHEFANEIDYKLKTVHFETNIGDSIQIHNSFATTPHIQQQYMEDDLLTLRPDKLNSPYPTTRINKFEVDDLNLSSARSTCSEDNSSEMETLRNTFDFDPIKAFIKPKSNLKTTAQKTIVNNLADGRPKSPRSLFMGLDD